MGEGQRVGDLSKSEVSHIQIIGDISQPQITTVKFDGNNYFTWSKSVLIYIQGKDKEEYLTSEMEIPSHSDPRYRKWKTKNAIIIGWLLNSMKLKISDHFLFLEIVHRIWDTLAKSYS